MPNWLDSLHLDKVAGICLNLGMRFPVPNLVRS